jgi:uncharacterized protein YcfJ
VPPLSIHAPLASTGAGAVEASVTKTAAKADTTNREKAFVDVVSVNCIKFLLDLAVTQ